VPCSELLSNEDLYGEGMSVDGEEYCDLVLDDAEMERMDRELDELDSDDVSCCCSISSLRYILQG
jgi:hypothetical protein